MPKTEVKEGLLEKLVPFLLLVSIILAFVVGTMWQRVSLLKKQATGTANVQQPQAGADVAGAAAPDPSGKLTDAEVKKIPPITDKDHIRGNKNAKVKIIEYSDYQCPYCERFHPVMQQVMQDYGDKVAWIYRHYPLDNIHPNARPAANAAECVASIGGEDAFWKFTDLVFSDQSKYLTNLASAAADSGVNKSQFQNCFDAKKFDSVITSDQNAGTGAGITGTPGSFIVGANGNVWLIPGALPYEAIKPKIDEALSS